VPKLKAAAGCSLGRVRLRVAFERVGGTQRYCLPGSPRRADQIARPDCKMQALTAKSRPQTAPAG
jgi:hypothetical protein